MTRRTHTNRIAETPRPSRSGRIEDAIAQLVQRRRATEPAPTGIESMTAPAFRSVVAERLRVLERDVAEVRTRINGLLFVVAGAVVTQVVLRLIS